MEKNSAVIYCRVAKKNDLFSELLAVAAQKKIIEQYVKQEQIEITKEYLDVGCSGFSVLRPELTRLFGDAASEKPPLVIVSDFSRFSRRNENLALPTAFLQVYCVREAMLYSYQADEKRMEAEIEVTLR